MPTAADYADLLNEPDLPDYLRADFERSHRLRVKREAMNARMSEQAKKDRTTLNWQRETLKVARELLQMKFEVNAWRQRPHLPATFDAAHSKLTYGLRRFRERTNRLHREVAAGDALQRQWMEDHAELLAAITRSGT